MPSLYTNFATLKALLTKAINADTSLDASQKASLAVRVTDLPKEASILLDQSKVSSVGGNVTEDVVNRAISVAMGAPVGSNRVEFDLIQFSTPRRVYGTKGVAGALLGHGGGSALPLVVAADISLQYRLSSSDAWQSFDRNVVLEDVEQIQFAAVIAQQAANSALPQLTIYAEQV